MKTAEEILREVLSSDFAKRPITDSEWEVMPIKKHILKAMELYNQEQLNELDRLIEISKSIVNKS